MSQTDDRGTDAARHDAGPPAPARRRRAAPARGACTWTRSGSGRRSTTMPSAWPTPATPRRCPTSSTSSTRPTRPDRAAGRRRSGGVRAHGRARGADGRRGGPRGHRADASRAVRPRTRPWGCVGFCMGGRFGLRAAETLRRRRGGGVAAAPLAAGHRRTRTRHTSRSAAIHGSLYLGFGENDHVTPPRRIPPLREQLERHDVAHRIDVIPGADHGFTMRRHALLPRGGGGAGLGGDARGAAPATPRAVASGRGRTGRPRRHRDGRAVPGRAARRSDGVRGVRIERRQVSRVGRDREREAASGLTRARARCRPARARPPSRGTRA